MYFGISAFFCYYLLEKNSILRYNAFVHIYISLPHTTAG